MSNSLNMILQHSGLVASICQPFLSNVNLHQFGYVEVFDNAEFFHVESSGCLLNTLVQRERFLHTPMDILTYNKHPGVHLSALYDNDYFPQDLSQIAKTFHLGQFLVLVEPHQTASQRSVRITTFGADINNYGINHVFVNNLDKFKDFSQYFAQRTQPLAEQCTLCSKTENNNEFKQLFNSFFDTDESDLMIDRENAPSVKDALLSDREHEIVALYAKGFTAKESAELLYLSKRTVERHFENLRKRFNCSNKIEILKQLEDLGVSFH